MPTYEYECSACGHAFERFQPITAAPVKRCPECNKPKVKRLISAGAGIVFKGSGFYITDYRSESYKNQAKGDAPAAAGDAAKPAESKPEAAKPAAEAPKAAKPDGGAAKKGKK